MGWSRCIRTRKDLMSKLEREPGFQSLFPDGDADVGDAKPDYVRADRTTFAMLGIPVGSELKLDYKGETYACETVDNETYSWSIFTMKQFPPGKRLQPCPRCPLPKKELNHHRHPKGQRTQPRNQETGSGQTLNWLPLKPYHYIKGENE
jgi:hypothetical protein